MMRTEAATGQQQAYADAVRHTFQSLAMVDDATLVGLTRMGIPEIEALKQEVAEILPAGNLPAFLLQGLVQLKDRTIKPERVAADLRLIFQATKQIGIFGTFLAAPALALHGYQKLLALAGKDVDSAFPDGPWQFYTEFGLREDAARHCAETIGFQQSAAQRERAGRRNLLGLCRAPDDLQPMTTCWPTSGTSACCPYARHHPGARAACSFPPNRARPSTPEHAATARRCRGADSAQAMGSTGSPRDGRRSRPYRLPPDTPLGDYAGFRRACFRAYWMRRCVNCRPTCAPISTRASPSGARPTCPPTSAR